MAINTPTRAYKEMASKWQLPLALLGGTPRMRQECKQWLPQLPDESDEVYRIRVERSFLFNVYKRTIVSMVGNAFSSNITVSGIPEELEYLEWNANGQGQSLTEHAAELFYDILVFGKCHNYVDFPSSNIERVNYAQYKKMGLRPYLARISPVNLIGWELSYNNGFENIEHIRISDVDVRIDEDFCEEEREIIRLVTPEYIRVYGRPFASVKNNDAGDFKIITEVPTKLNEGMKSGDIDISPISSFSYAESFDQYMLLPDLSVSSYGKVNSIYLFHKKSIEEIKFGKIALPTTSPRL